jgi:hypothetical protein
MKDDDWPFGHRPPRFLVGDAPPETETTPDDRRPSEMAAGCLMLAAIGVGAYGLLIFALTHWSHHP